MSKRSHCATCTCSSIGPPDGEHACPGCGSLHTVYTVWVHHNDDAPRWWLIAGPKADPVPVDFCPACGFKLTEPCGVGGCGTCLEMRPLYCNPHGAVARCVPCRRLDDANEVLSKHALAALEAAEPRQL